MYYLGAPLVIIKVLIRGKQDGVKGRTCEGPGQKNIGGL